MLKGRRERSGANQYAAGTSLAILHNEAQKGWALLVLGRGTLIRRRERRFTVAEWQYRIDASIATRKRIRMINSVRFFASTDSRDGNYAGTARAGDARRPEVSPNL